MIRELHELFTISVGQYKLLILYDKTQDGLYQYFSSDSRMKEYISSHLSEAFLSALHYHDEGSYILNIASTEDLGAFDWKNERGFLSRQLHIFMPIMQEFILNAITGWLKDLAPKVE